MAGKYLRKRQKKKGVGVLLVLLLVLFSGVIGVSIWKITETKQERAAGVEAYASLAQSVVMPQENTLSEVETVVVSADAQPEEEKTVDVSQPLTVDFEALQAINSQVIGWISSDTGAINYPVVQGTDNDYYLTHLVDGTYNSNGSIFVDFRNAPGFADRNTIIYGHNMLNGAMFASLSLYSTPGYPAAHPELLLVTDEGSFSLQVFAGCVVPGNSDLYQMSYNGDEEFITYIDRVRSISDFTTEVPINEQDRIVTLSTCSYNYDDARYLLFCKLVPMR